MLARDAARASGWSQRWFWDVRGARARRRRLRTHSSRPAQRSLTPGDTGHALVLYPVIAPDLRHARPARNCLPCLLRWLGHTCAPSKRGCLRVGGGARRGDASREWTVLLGGRCAPDRGGRTYATVAEVSASTSTIQGTRLSHIRGCRGRKVWSIHHLAWHQPVLLAGPGDLDV